MISFTDIGLFMMESNKIEGIMGTMDCEVVAAQSFLLQPIIAVDDLVGLVLTLQPDARLRTEVGLDVVVGDYVPPPGDPRILNSLDELLAAANNYSCVDHCPAFTIHNDYETLHPFTDGNGRSGRLLWLWMMGNKYDPRLGFLHTWYYQSLEAQR